jgi:hypothetical protein
MLLLAAVAPGLQAQGFYERSQPAKEAEAARFERALERLRMSRPAFVELAKRQPNLRLTPEGEAFHVCEIPAGSDLGSESPAASGAPVVAAAAVGSDTSGFVQTTQYPASQTFRLHSRKGARRMIYLDFDGHVTPAGGPWGGRIVSPAYDTDGNPSSFGGAERGAIQQIWRQVAEDFAPFDVDVTTEEPGAGALGYSGPGDTVWGMRVVIGGSASDWYKGGAGGVAFVGSFQRATEVPCFVFSKNLYGFNSIAYAASHEVGHTFGLSHDGTLSGDEYHNGQGNWAPIMGAGYGKSVVQWSKGDYADANNSQDDLALIAQEAPYGDPGIALTRETALELQPGDTAGGIIPRDVDQAWYRIPMTDGAVDIVGEVASPSPNLKLRLALQDEAGVEVASTAVGSTMGARLRANVASGIHYLIVDGIGAGDPRVSFDGYGSIGRFRISGTWPNNLKPLASAAGSTPLVGRAPLAVAFRSDVSVDLDGSISGVSWDFGDGSPVETSSNPIHVYPTPGNYVVRLTVTDNLGAAAHVDTPVRVVATATGPRSLSIVSGAASWGVRSRTVGRARASFRVVDSAGRPLPGVTVTASLTGLTSAFRSAVTDRAGYAVIQSDDLPSSAKGSVTFTVRAAVREGYAYLPARNRVTTAILRR